MREDKGLWRDITVGQVLLSSSYLMGDATERRACPDNTREKDHGLAAIPNVIVKDEEIFVAISSGGVKQPMSPNLR